MGYLTRRLAVEDKVAVIFGGAGGLGRACAEEFARAGMSVAVADRNPDLLASLTDHLADTGRLRVADCFDVRDADRCGEFFDRVDAELGRTDVLVNVVGGTFPQPFDESTPKGWDTIIRTNFTWLLHTTQLAIPRLRAQGGGSVINLTSIEAHRAAPNHAVYSGMKAAVTNWSRTLAVELGPDQIRVNTIAPDFVPTEGLLAIMPPDLDGSGAALAATIDSIAVPQARRGNYGDVGGCALFLASDLSRYVTGSTLHPDGGAIASSGWFNWPDEGWRNSPPGPVVTAYLDHD